MGVARRDYEGSQATFIELGTDLRQGYGAWRGRCGNGFEGCGGGGSTDACSGSGCRGEGVVWPSEEKGGKAVLISDIEG